MLPCTIQQLMAIRNVSDTSKYRNVTVIGNDYTGHINRTRLWTTKFIPTSNHSISPPSTPDPFIPFVNTPFAPSQVIFVTDFRSYSAASVLLKQVQLYHLAKVICFGYAFGNSSSNRIDASVGATGPKVRTDLSSFNATKMNGTALFPRLNTEASYAAGMLYYEHPNGTDIPLHFLPLPPDAIIPEWFSTPLTPANLHRIAEVIRPYFYQCSNWEIRNSPDCTSSQIKKLAPERSFALYGNPCDPLTHHFKDDECVFSECQYGYSVIPNTTTCIPRQNKTRPSKA